MSDAKALVQCIQPTVTMQDQATKSNLLEKARRKWNLILTWKQQL
jgi:hypothetical protein